MTAITLELLDRARGCLLGAAVGDAFGAPFNGLPRQPVNAQVRELRRGRLPAGHFTTETEALLEAASRLLAGESVSLATAAAVKSPGGATRSLLARLAGSPSRADPTPAAAAATADARALLIALPIALACARDHLCCRSEVRRQLEGASAHPNCVAGGAVVTLALWHLLHGSPPRQAMQLGLHGCGDVPPTLEAAILQGPGRLRDQLNNDSLVQPVLESISWGLIHAASYQEAVTRVANLGGRAALASALVGALAGAAFRPSGIPADWRNRLHGTWPSHGGRPWGERDFMDLADRLVQAAGWE